jgi:hypothetical protein
MSYPEEAFKEYSLEQMFGAFKKTMKPGEEEQYKQIIAHMCGLASLTKCSKLVSILGSIGNTLIKGVTDDCTHHGLLQTQAVGLNKETGDTISVNYILLYTADHKPTPKQFAELVEKGMSKANDDTDGGETEETFKKRMNPSAN